MNWYKTARTNAIILDFWQLNNEIKIAGKWKDFTEFAFPKGLWNTVKGVGKTIGGALWATFISPFDILIEAAAPRMTGDVKAAWSRYFRAVKMAISGGGDAVYGAAQMGAGGIKQMYKLADFLYHQIKSLAGQHFRNNKKMNDISSESADNVKGKILDFANVWKSRMAA